MEESEIKIKETAEFATNLAKRICKEIAFAFDNDIGRTTCLGYVTVKIFAAFLNNLDEKSQEQGIININYEVLELLKFLKNKGQL